MAQHIQVIPYCSEWEEQYKRESSFISDILGSELIEIHHIGSTAVRGLSAKPIIDIMPIVKEVSRIDKFYPQFEAIGYECLGEFGMSYRRYFRKGGDERTHQIHIFEESNTKDINRHLAVRDYLRNHTEVAAEYGRLKTELAKKYPYDIGSYCNGKDDFVKDMENKALQWWIERTDLIGNQGEIRKFMLKDIDRIMHLWLETNKQTHDFIDSSYWDNNFISVKEMLPQSTIYVYDCNNQIQGFIGLIDNYIAGIFISKENQSRGIGKKLLNYAKEKCERLTLQVYQKNARAVQFYLREGFSISKEQLDEETGEIEYFMEWRPFA